MPWYMPWYIYRDFNSSLISEDRTDGQSIPDNETRDFQNAMDILNLVYIKAISRHFTCRNKHI